MDQEAGSDGWRGARFQTTQWNLIAAAAAPPDGAARAALEVLCAAYWYPLYAYIRHRGFRVQEAEDLTQAFFTKMLEEKGIFRRAHPAQGRFRSYLLGALRHFLLDEADRIQATKRGGRQNVVPLDIAIAEERLQGHATSPRSPEWHFDREWALTVLRTGLEALSHQCEFDGTSRELFANLRPHLAGEDSQLLHRELATKLQMTEGAIKTALHRLRKRYRQCIRDEIARTLGPSMDIEEEIKDLFDALRR